MCWLKRDIWKVAVILVSLGFLLVLMVWIPASSVGASERRSELAIAGTPTVQTTPTEDATVTALNKEKLRQEIQQLKNQNGNQNNWFMNNSTALIAAAATVIVALFGILQWAITARQAKDKELRDREDERRKDITAQDKELRDRAEERFKTAVTALGVEKEGTQVGGAILLRSFLNPDDKEIYGRYYTQIFDLAVAYLRLRQPTDPQKPEPPDSLSQALFTVFKEAVPHVHSKFLDASRVHLDGASLDHANLSHIYMRGATLTYAHLDMADLTGTLHMKANFTGADLWGINLEGASLHDANFTDATLIKANLMNANLTGADLTDADLSGADLRGANLTGTILQRAQYNTKKIRMKVENERPVINPQGPILVEEPTKWPKEPNLDGAIDVSD